MLAVDVKGLAYVCEAAFPHLKEKGGAIINFSSGAALMDGPANLAVYSAAKGAVITYSRSIAREWAKYNIRVNSVIPNAMTEMVEETLAALTPEGRAKFAEETFAQIPLGGKLGDIETDLAPALLFLASDGAKYITSQIINVDGGLTYTR
jgi:2-hydroxycyclohexanecarboxyl-CoA dehydrogenase